MKTTSLCGIVLVSITLIAAAVTSVDAQVTVISGEVHIIEPIEYESVVVAADGILICDAPVTTIGDFTVQTGGRIYHTAGNAVGVHLVVGGILRIELGAVIHGNSRGNSANVPVNWGGSYGGVGAHGPTAANAFGVIEEALVLGNGGHWTRGGGLVHIEAETVENNGEIQAIGQTRTDINCVMAGASAGGGSGGSIQIEAGEIRGSGWIRANGGNGHCSYLSNDDGGGGGGRIVLRYDTRGMSFPSCEAFGGTGPGGAGSAGTIFLRESRLDDSVSGSLVVNNRLVAFETAPPFLTNINHYKRIIVENSGALVADGANDMPPEITVHDGILVGEAGSLAISALRIINEGNTHPDIVMTGAGTLSLDAQCGMSSGSSILLEGGRFITEADVEFRHYMDFNISGGTYEIAGSSTTIIPEFGPDNVESGNVVVGAEGRLVVLANEITVGADAYLYKNGSFGTDGDEIGVVTVLDRGHIRHSTGNATGLHLSVTNILTILAGGIIDANSRGNSADVPVNWGGSYGGVGAHGPTAANAFGVIEEALVLGNGGHWTRGGGLIHIKAETVENDGEIQAIGQTRTDINCVMAGASAGGGSGGSIQIEAGEIRGSGWIRANGGNGYCSYLSNDDGGGGGGRIVLLYDIRGTSFPQAEAIGGIGPGGTGSPGTVFDRPSRDDSTVLADVRIDNRGRESFLYTPLLHGVPEIRTLVLGPYVRTSVVPQDGGVTGLTIRDTLDMQASARLELTGQTVDLGEATIGQGARIFSHIGPTDLTFRSLVLQDGAVEADTTLIIAAESRVAGVGQLLASVVNVGTLQSGQPLGTMEMFGDYTQQAYGTYRVGFRNEATPAVSRLVVHGKADLAGALEVEMTGVGGAPTAAELSVLASDATNGSLTVDSGQYPGFEAFPNRNEIYLTYEPTAQIVPIPDPVLLVSPSGNVPFYVRLEDGSGNPVVGSRNVWLEFPEFDFIRGCDVLTSRVYAVDATNSEGEAVFLIRAGGCPEHPVEVCTSSDERLEVPVRAFDVNGDRVVSFADYTGSHCNDYNNDGMTNETDFEIFRYFMGQSCDQTEAYQGTISIRTVPEPLLIRPGTNVQVVADLSNHMPYGASIDSVVFETANWGIAHDWRRIGSVETISVPPRSDVAASVVFRTPDAYVHGCFRVNAYIDGLKVESLNRDNSVPDLVYGLNRFDGSEWAYIGLTDGSLLAACGFDSARSEPDWGRWWLFDLPHYVLESELDIPDLRTDYLVSLNATRQAAELWDSESIPGVNDPELSETIRSLSKGIDIYVRSAPDVQKELFECPAPIEGCDPCMQSNFVCGPNKCNGFDFADRLANPEWHFKDCCMEHDWLYCRPRDCTPEEKREIDAEFQSCLLGKCNDYASADDMTHCRTTAFQFFGAVRRYGNPSYMCNNRHCKCGTPQQPTYCNPPPEARQMNVNQRAPQGASKSFDDPITYDGIVYVGQDTFRTQVPVGSAEGDSLNVYAVAALPDGWIDLSRIPGVVAAPDTLEVVIAAPAVVNCRAPGVVRLFAVVPGTQEYAGEAEVWVRPVDSIGDLDADDDVDGDDVAALMGLICSGTGIGNSLESGDANKDGQIDVADVAALQRYLAGTGPHPSECIDGPVRTTTPDERFTIQDNGMIGGRELALLASEPVVGLQLASERVSGGEFAIVSPEGLTFVIGARGAWDVAVVTRDDGEPFGGTEEPIVIRMIDGVRLLGASVATVDGASVRPIIEDSIVPTLFRGGTVTVGDGSVDIEWRLGAHDGQIELYRCLTGTSDYTLVCSGDCGYVLENGVMVYRFQDMLRDSSQDYTYQLRLIDATGAVTTLWEAGTDNQADVPRSLVLDLIAPNPFNATVGIRFGLPKPQNIEIAVYDLHGRRVRELHRGALAAGYHWIKWNGVDEHERAVSAGVYIVGVRSEGGFLTKKATYLK